MKLKDLSKEDLQNMSYDDIAYILLSENNKQMKIIELFTEVGKLIDLSQQEIEDKIGDFFEMLSLDKRFIMLDNGYWDLKTRHAQKLVIDEEEEELNIEEVDEKEEEEKESENIFFDEENDDDNGEDDLKDLVVISDEEEEENNF